MLRVLTLATPNPIMAETATRVAVQVPWDETAFKPMETPSNPDAATKIQSRQNAIEATSRPMGPKMISAVSANP